MLLEILASIIIVVLLFKFLGIFLHLSIPTLIIILSIVYYFKNRGKKR